MLYGLNMVSFEGGRGVPLMSSRKVEVNDYMHTLESPIILHYCKFQILQEVGAKRKVYDQHMSTFWHLVDCF